MSYEVIVVSDGSTDDTVSAINDIRKTISGVHVIDNKVNRGKGYAVACGMQKARGRLRIFMDADNATHIDQIEKLLPYLSRTGSLEKADVLLGSIGVAGAQINKSEWWLRTILGRGGNLCIRTFLLPGIYDTQRGFKLFTQTAAEYIFPQLTINRWGFDLEVLLLAKRGGYIIYEVPIQWTHQAESKIRPSAYVQVLIDVIKLWWRFRART